MPMTGATTESFTTEKHLPQPASGCGAIAEGEIWPPAGGSFLVVREPDSRSILYFYRDVCTGELRDDYETVQFRDVDQPAKYMAGSRAHFNIGSRTNAWAARHCAPAEQGAALGRRPEARAGER